jgi:DNA-binding GntR family transcriptional regulator
MRERISRGELRPGEQILQETLASELGLSVVPLREALKTLEAEGQVVYAPHRGYFVARLDMAELTEAYRIRELLEDEAVRRGMPQLVH